MRFIQSLINNWQRFSPKKRTALVLFLGTVMIGLVLMSWYLFVPRYVTLFSNLDPDQVYNISEALRSDNLPFKLAAAGTAITVPEKQVHEIRVRVAGEGLYNTGVGFELFDGVRLGITDFERRLNLQRALQEELRRTIVRFPEIDQARVHLVIPEQSLFQGNKQLPTASIALEIRPYQQLGAEQVRSLVYLVSMSVPGLPPENVVVINTSGQILSDRIATGKEDSLGLSASQMELKSSFEGEIESRLLGMLEQIFGPGKAVAMVTADLNFDHSTVTRITYDSDNAVLRSEHVVRERVEGAGSNGGVPGTDSNIPVYPGEGDTDEYIYERDEHSKDWEIGSDQQTIVTAPGRVQRLSASVTLSASLSPEEKLEIQGMVVGAMGLDISRGDNLSISGISFNTDHLTDIGSDFENIARNEMLQYYLGYGLRGLTVLLGFIFLLVIGSKLLKSEPLPELQPVHTSADAIFAKQAAAAKDGDSEMDYIRNLVNGKPGEVADIMRAWAYED